jgi:hypothetical protein
MFLRGLEKGNCAMRISSKAMLVVALFAATFSAGAGEADPVVKRMLEAKGTPFEVDSDGDYKIIVSYKSEGRTQLVYVRSAVETWGKHRIREVWSYAYQAPSNQFSALVANRLLQASNEVKLGAWVKQKNRALMIVKVNAEASAEELDSAISFAAEVADEMEKELTDGGDEF